MFGTIRCPVCGAVNGADTPRCARCWAELHVERERAVAWQPDRRHGSLPGKVIGGVLLAGLLVWFLVSRLVPPYPRTIQVARLEITVASRTVQPPSAGGLVDDGRQHVIVLDLVVRNLTGFARSLDPAVQIALADGHGHRYQPLSGWPDADLPTEIPPGGTVTGRIAFLVPTDAADLRLIVSLGRVFKPGEIALP